MYPTSRINDQRRRTGEDAHVFQLTMFPRRGGEFSDDKVATITTQPTSLVVNSDTPQSTLECFSETRSWQLQGQTSRYPCLSVQKPPDSSIAPSQAPRCPMRLRLDQFNGSSNTAVQTCAHHQAHLSMGKYLQLVLGSGGPSASPLSSHLSSRQACHVTQYRRHSLLPANRLCGCGLW